MPFAESEYSLLRDQVIITNTADPINNFRLMRHMDENGVFLSVANYIKVYEIINGVVTP